MDGDLLYLNTCNGVDNTHRRIRRPDAATLIAVDKRTGRLLAQDTERIGPRIVHCQWSSPALGMLAGRPPIVLGGADAVVRVFEPLERLSADREASATLRCVGRLDLDPGTVKANACEWNGRREAGGPSTIKGMAVLVDGRIYVAVGGDRWWGKREAWVVCIDAEPVGVEVRLRERWRRPLVRHCMSTPAVRDGLVFIPDSGGKLHCFDAGDGTPRWTMELSSEVSGSPLCADGRVFIGTHRRRLHTLRAAAALEVLGDALLEGGAIWGSPAAANGRLYVATHRRLYAVAGDRRE